MKPNSRFLVAAALILVVPLSTVLLFSARGHTDSSLYRAAMRVLGPAVFLGGTFLMYPVAMIDAALFGGAFFRNSLFGFEPRDGYGWMLYLVFYSILALSAGFAARSWPSRARAVRPVSVPARGAFEPSTSGALSGAAAVSPRSGRSVLGVPLRLLVGLLCALPVLWCAMPRRIDPTVGKNDADGYPQECRGEKLYRFTFVQQPKPIERHKPVYSDKARNSKVKGLVSVRLAVLSSGEVCEPRIIEGLHPEVDASILAAVRTWRFTPGTYKGTPVAVGWYQPFHIDFSDPDPAALRRAAERQEAERRAAERAALRNGGAAPVP